MQEKPTVQRANHLKNTGISRNKLSSFQFISRVILLIIVVGLLGIASLLVWSALNQHGDATNIQFDLEVDPSLNPIEAAGLALYLQANQERLYSPINEEGNAIIFEINPGENANQIADNLLSLGLINDTVLFRNYLRYHGLDRQLEAGAYELSSTMTIPEIAIILTDATLPEIEIRITEGWRREQIADWIDQQQDIPFTGGEFLVASSAGAIWPEGTTLGSDVPADASLEGFLFPDTYRIAINGSASDLVEKMLTNIDKQFTSQMRDDATAKGLTVYEVLTLASIVEREAADPEERTTIASVYLNRLAIDMVLQADPTVQYAMGFQAATGEWWNRGLTQEDYTAIDSAYNTYLYPGLPPGPIANPGLSSIQAVIYAEETPYLFFRTTCDDSGRHVFSTTYEEHLQNACP